MIIVENHLGNTYNALSIAEEQNKILNKIAVNPEHFDLVLNFKSNEVEIYVNDLNFEKALELSTNYLNTVDTFKEVWGLMVDNKDNGFDKSRSYIKAQMIQFRIELLNNKIDINLNSLGNKLSNKYDISRFENYKIMLLLKQNKSKLAVNKYIELLKEDEGVILNYFDLFWFLKSINESLLREITLNTALLNNLIQNQIKNFDFNKIGHPIDLILRELSLFEFNLGDKSKALKYIRKSRGAFNLENSNIAIWLRILIDIHEDYFKDKLKDESEYLNDISKSPFYKIIENESSLSLIEKVRYYSPY